MGAQTKLSAKGQVVIPKDVRDRLGLAEGAKLDIVETAAGLLLRPVRAGKVTREHALARIRKAIDQAPRDRANSADDDPVGIAIRAKWGDHRPKAQR